MREVSAPRYTLALLLAFIGACAGDASDSSGETASALEAACNQNTGAPPGACECLASGAEAELSPAALEWLAAAMSGETAIAVKLKDDVPIAELIEASTFMMNYAENCALPEAALSQIQ